MRRTDLLIPLGDLVDGSEKVSAGTRERRGEYGETKLSTYPLVCCRKKRYRSKQEGGVSLSSRDARWEGSGTD